MADIKHTVTIEAPPERVFHTITSKEGLEGWWTSDVEDNDRNGIYTLGFRNHTILMTMRGEKERANEYVEWKCTGELPEWIDTRLIFDIVSLDNGKTQLNFTHADWKATDEDFVKCTTDWGHLMHLLKGYAEGRLNTPMFR